jgi:hypothetical protein
MNQTASLLVAPVADVRRDFQRNLPWLGGLLGLTLVYIPISAAVIRVWETGWGFWHACYFTVINMTTVGFGDVVPATHAGKLIAGFNAFAGLLLFGALVAVFALAFQPAAWSASLTATSPAEAAGEAGVAVAPKAEHNVADVLEGLAKLIRTGTSSQSTESPSGRVHIHVHGRSPGNAYIDVLVRVDAG